MKTIQISVTKNGVVTSFKGLYKTTTDAVISALSLEGVTKISVRVL